MSKHGNIVVFFSDVDRGAVESGARGSLLLSLLYLTSWRFTCQRRSIDHQGLRPRVRYFHHHSFEAECVKLCTFLCRPTEFVNHRGRKLFKLLVYSSFFPILISFFPLFIVCALPSIHYHSQLSFLPCLHLALSQFRLSSNSPRQFITILFLHSSSI